MTRTPNPFRWFALFGLFACLTSPLAAQETPTMEHAMALLQAEKWAEAAQAFEAITQATPQNGQAWYRLAVAQRRQQAYDAAIKAWEQAAALGFAPVFTQYNIASTYAIQGNRAQAFAWLEKAVELGLQRPEVLANDSDFEAMKDDPRFTEIMTGIQRNATPCEFDPRYRQFDFWIGEWVVSNPQGQQVGTNRIEKILNGCVLLENWTSGSGGGGGKSFNYFDPATAQWKQLWVDAVGGHITFAGTFTDGAMRLVEGQEVQPDGTTTLMRMTFTPLADGRVRQFVEQSLDGGETWNVWFDGYYAKKEQP